MTPEIAASEAAFATRSRWTRGCLRLLRAIYHPLAFYGLLTIFALSCLVWGLLAMLLLLVLPRRVGQSAGQFLIMAGFRYFIALMRASGIMRCDLAALDALRDKRPLVIAPNHPSQLDVMLIISRLPHVVCTAKARLLNNPLFGASARLAGYIRNDVPVHLIREAVRQLREGRQLLIFPEGTRSSGAGVDPFKGGFALIAQQAAAPVQMVFIDSNSRFLAKGWPWLRMPNFPLTYRVRLGPVLDVTGDRHDFAVALYQSCCRELNDSRS
jgi:1-acyl-sn-glycerol-3-phosphate acyltransferase